MRLIKPNIKGPNITHSHHVPHQQQIPHKVKIELKVVKHWDTFKPTGLVPRVKVECNLKVMRAGARRGISWKVILLLALSRLLQVKVNIPPQSAVGHVSANIWCCNIAIYALM